MLHDIVRANTRLAHSKEAHGMEGVLANETQRPDGRDRPSAVRFSYERTGRIVGFRPMRYGAAQEGAYEGFFQITYDQRNGHPLIARLHDSERGGTEAHRCLELTVTLYNTHVLRGSVE